MNIDYIIDKETPILLKQKNKFEKNQILSQTQFPKNYTYFHVMGHDEPHAIRRQQILQHHPEIAKLYGKDPMTAWFAFSFVFLQIISANYFQHTNWYLFLLSSYTIGGTLTHALHGVVHDVTHYLCFENILLNRLLAIFCNFGQAVPSAITFGRYHSDHHTFMGISHLDPDLPSTFELKYIRGVFIKFLFMIFLPFFYAVRPLIVRPLIPTFYEILNIVSVILVDIVIYHFIGSQALVWLLCSTYFGLSGLHPFAIHLIAEHYEFVNRLETYDYIGWANFFILNIGYHTEHHDFPMVPWNRLPLIRQYAPEFYDNLPHHNSYMMISLKYILDDYMGPFSRIVRKIIK